MKNTILFLCLFLLPLSLGAQQIEGARYSDRGHVAQLFQLCLSWSPPEPEALEACLMDSELFASVQVSRDQGQWKVEVEDRWSLLPVPVIVAEDHQETKAGLFLAERNFLGKGALLLVGGTSSPSTALALMRYEDHHFWLPQGYVRLTATFARRQIYLFYDEAQVLDGRDETRRHLDLLLGRALGPDWLVAMSFTAQELAYRPYQGFKQPADHSARWLGALARFDNSRYRFYFDAGHHGEVHWRFESQSGTAMLKSDYRWQGALKADQALQVRLQSDFSTSDETALAVQGGGAPGARGVPAYGLWAGRYLSASFDYQIPLSYTPWGIVTTAPFVDLGWVDLAGSERVVTYAAHGLGGYFFLKQVSLPGLGLYLGQNNRYATFFVKFFLGFEL